jgi:hypothetical protein
VLGLPTSLPAPDPADPAIAALLRACHLAFGVSYYKAALPVEIVAPGLSASEAAFWDLLYSEGMGEFYFRNGLAIPAQPGFAAATRTAEPPQAQAHPASPGDAGTPASSGRTVDSAGATATPLSLGAFRPPERALVLIGGGKDSGLVAEIVRASGVPAEALALGSSPWMERSASAAGLRLHRVTRQIDPALLHLNERGAWNGHVPISACIAAVSMLVARAAGFSDVLVGNERGADDANLIWEGRMVNHQWSKSSRFEQAFQTWCDAHVGARPRYASLLRPLGEIRIAERFAQCTGQHANFTSCNRNFRLDPSQHPERWCGECAKCVFVALILAPHLDDAANAGIFGRDILGSARNRRHVEALLGLTDSKPWDCVGTARECWLSLLALARRQALPSTLADLTTQAPAELRDAGFDVAWAEELAAAPALGLSPVWRARLDAYLGAA